MKRLPAAFYLSTAFKCAYATSLTSTLGNDMWGIPEISLHMTCLIALIEVDDPYERQGPVMNPGKIVTNSGLC